ncbi:esterase, PHB depolymerase family protein [Paramagnetospirillum caucaseum]|uniref:Esterase, PHB depolymerase family protein n=1 Tax=Paramagnetospirillum caucaseum TaxID=1244869 RepID=M2ZSK2_9PROT|nr:PHB depolymerase family esterase [Paramagnetospirillum caucaseum]EME70327.1 esterase, PHB depolymerase family protein [Paramagnetospirillum caucaseum]
MISRLGALLLAVASLWAAPTAAAGFESVSGLHAGGSQLWWWNLEVKAYVPDAARGRPGPMVLLLHGCKQEGIPFAVDSGWRDLAEKRGFALLVAEFKDSISGAPGNNCLWWFDAEERQPTGRNITGRLHQAVMKARESYGMAGGDNFVVGLSAGGAMAQVLLAALPDDFAAGASMAGVPVGCARIGGVTGGSYFATPEVRRAFGCMEGPAEVRPQDWAAEISRQHPPRAKWPRLSVWHGDADKSVACVNAVETAAQWAGLHGAALPAFTTCEQTHRNPPPFDPVWTATRGGAETVVELRLLPGLSHAVPVAPGAGCGRESEYVVNAGVCAAAEIAGFFGL